MSQRYIAAACSNACRKDRLLLNFSGQRRNVIDASDRKQFAYLLKSYLQFAPSNDRANTFTSAHKMALGQHFVGDSKSLVQLSGQISTAYAS